jgi:type I restriction enzyme S subunit
MPNDWPLVPLGDAPVEILDGDRGVNYPKQTDFSERGHCLFLNAGNVTKGGFDFSQCAFITPAKDSALRKGKLTRQDVVLTTRGTVGNVAFYNGSVPFDHIRINSGMVVLRADQRKLVPQFLYQFVKSPDFDEQVSSLTTGSAQPQFPIRDIRHVSIPIPSLDEQRAIARVLGALDDKIELNRRLNRTLEELAAALFRSWFVDFDPVVAKAAGRKPAHLRPAVAALFPAHWQDSPLGPIPHGWEVKTIEDLARYVNGRAFTKGASGTGRMVIRIAELNSGPGGSTVYSDITAAPENVAQPGDLLFAWSGSLDVYRWYRDEAIINQHIFKVICEEYPQWFVHQALREAMPFFKDTAADKATTMGHIKREHLSHAFLAMPPKDLLDAADKIFQPIYAKQLGNERESLTLAALRDTLLPKLLSGELRVKQAEKLVEAKG